MQAMKRMVEIIGVPLDLGANTRGANLAPTALRIAGLHAKIKELGYELRDHGDLPIPSREAIPLAHHQQKFLPELIEINTLLSQKTYAALNEGHMPLTLGGDHSLAIGSVAGVSRYFKERQQPLGLLWIDAHGDLNTPATSPSGNLHGMPLSVLLGQGFPALLSLGFNGAKLQPQHTVLLGIRSLDEEERRLCKSSGIRYYTMREIDERGIPAVMREALATLNTPAIHLSFDLDAVDPQFAPGVSTPVTGGLSYREAHLAMEMLADSGRLVSMDFVELNPMMDVQHKSASLLIEFIQSALGKAII